MKNKKKLFTTTFLVLLLIAIATPLAAFTPASAEETSQSIKLLSDDTWYYMKNDMITIMFPRNGEKPMFLWRYTNNPNSTNVVKFKGLIEYTTYEKPYFLWRCQAEPLKIRERIQAHYYGPKQHMFQNHQRQMAEKYLDEIEKATDLHAPYLPFGGSTWELEGPENVTRGEVEYLSFNFTLVDVPPGKADFQFAERNIILRCRFYYTPATEDVYGKYTYTVNAGELKIDIIVKHWQWNIDKLDAEIDELRELGMDIPEAEKSTSLALWVNLASIPREEIGTAEADAQSTEDIDLTESVSVAQNMYVEGARVSITQNNKGKQDEAPLQRQGRERFRLRFEEGNTTTLAGFFKFVPQAIITDGITYNTTDVTASYITAGKHMSLYIGYPYFDNYTLEHDPSIGLENITPWLPTNTLMILIGATIFIAVAIAAIKIRKKPVNIVSIQ